MGDVRLENISRIYGDFSAVDNLSLDMKDGEFVVLVGPSGCGKSTTLRMIAGLEKPTSGRIYIAGRDVTDLLPRERNIAMVFQSYALYPHMTVYENIAFPLKMGFKNEGGKRRRYSRKDIEERVNRVAAILDIKDQLDKKPKQLSGGQRQRVALGRAIVRDPEVFLMDEPLSNLDAKLRTKMRIELKRLHRELGTTIIYVTHDQLEAMTLADRIAIMNRGVLQQYTTPLEAYNHPANTFVATFIGNPGMNMIEGRLKPHPRGYTFTSGQLSFDLHLAVGKRVYNARLKDPEVTYGIRPEDVDVSRTPRDGYVRAEVYGTELLGNITYLHLLCGGVKITSQASPEFTAAIGDVVYVSLSSEKGHVFDTKGRSVGEGE